MNQPSVDKCPGSWYGGLWNGALRALRSAAGVLCPLYRVIPTIKEPICVHRSVFVLCWSVGALEGYIRTVMCVVGNCANLVQWACYMYLQAHATGAVGRR